MVDSMSNDALLKQIDDLTIENKRLREQNDRFRHSHSILMTQRIIPAVRLVWEHGVRIGTQIETDNGAEWEDYEAELGQLFAKAVPDENK